VTQARVVAPEVTSKQLEVITNHTASTLWMRGGMRSGKTFAGAWWTFCRSAENPPHVEGMLVSPNYPMLKLGPFKAMEAVFRMMGVRFLYKGGTDKVFIWWDPSGVARRIWCRSADKPESLSGATLGFVWVDEPGLCPAETFHRVSTRVSALDAVFLQKLFTGTPEGVRNWFHTKTAKAEERADPRNLVIAATTYDNTFNHPSYFQDIEDTYADDPAGRQQYVLGIATDRQGNIYTNVRDRHFEPHGIFGPDQMCAGWDFNIDWMVTSLATWNEYLKRIHVWGEVVTHGKGTEEHAEQVVDVLKTKGMSHERYQGRMRLTDGQGRPCLVYADASGKARKTSATPGVTDLTLVRDAGFSLRNGDSNPRQRDRITSMQYALRHDRLRICPVGAPQHALAIKTHARNKWGEPQKDWLAGEFQADHYMDGLGYLVHGFIPVGSSKHKPKPGAPVQPNITRLLYGSGVTS
jgi:hypothetical protein